ncbi:aminotransferase class I/II-fold pyridoxal phosphate-dependent enzyme [Gracilibacillus caseinilyticus]|uniref:cysteine-S-conjugate beta-lyase n=1 Tax=Gracilibacillus caseinilyticus TaxID=2932256 RepID=A0ABY4ESY2_9BACI|nr:aminotransferase class I/II-fold pyridoxal phosphate-dependent enzyme [Gracilibacillus caseinilyticus]UOQ47075.1 aminotransferase class I/II-fold pyridoxal phosphate-dependent enzyme [Gracilibacillus caseinilyticus]
MTHKKETLLAHGGNQQGYHEKYTGAVNPPIYVSSTYHQQELHEFGPYDYSRSGNPTRDQLEATIAKLENGVAGFAFSSGMAAISSAFMLLETGDHIVISKDVYGGTFRFVTKLLAQFSIEHTFVDMTNLSEVEEAIQPNTKVIYIETPANPLLQITDIRAVVSLAKENDCFTFLDNTFMTPLYQQPLDLGVDIVLHSATKFLSGHSDIVAGLAVTKSEELAGRLKFVQNTYGAILGAKDCYQLLQGMKTLEPRFQKSASSAEKIASNLTELEGIDHVYYPGLKNHPGAAIHASQSTSAGAVLSFTLQEHIDPEQFVSNMTIPVFAVSLGAVESILSHPATMSHAAMPPHEREARGISHRLFRLSVGVEDVNDLLTDITNSLTVSVKESISK